jgi:CRISPR system Cascade subunit CasB
MSQNDSFGRSPGIGQIVARTASRLGAVNFPTGERAALRRLSPEDPSSGIGAVCRLLHMAGFDGGQASPEHLKRWALVLHGMALMSGPGTNPHNPSKRPGGAFADAKLSDQRFTRLLNARGPAFRDLIPRLARFVAGQGQSFDWEPLARLILYEGRNEQVAEDIRLRIAAQFYAARAKAEDSGNSEGAIA